LGHALLTRLGYEVVTCTGSLEALEVFRAAPQSFDLVITDQTMPQMTGETLARELRHLRSDIPIILCTGFSHTITAEKAQALGLDTVCMKPLVAHELGVAIRRVLAHRTTAPRPAEPLDAELPGMADDNPPVWCLGRGGADVGKVSRVVSA
jgi:CheY-like chemotaxis protein